MAFVKKKASEEDDSLQRPLSPLAGFLSLLVPGFGQIYQGRIGKGILFFVCIYTLFFYGFSLGHGRNVYLPHTADENNPWDLAEFPADLYNRPQYVAQFAVGAVAWPALVHYSDPQKGKSLFGEFQSDPTEQELNELQRNGDKTWDLGWVMTVIAGALNVLVIYDAVSGPAFPRPPSADKDEDNENKEEKETK